MTDQDQQIAELQMRISGLERDLTALNRRASDAMIAYNNMQIWFLKYPEHPQKNSEMERLETVRQRALNDFTRVSQALERARQQLIELTQQPMYSETSSE